MHRLLILFILCLSAQLTMANITLPAIFGDNMVLQQRDTVTIWGWGKALEPVSVQVSWQEQPLRDTVNSKGQWAVRVLTPAAGGPHTIAIRGWNEIRLENVMTGEVWLCSGQSNMEWSARLGIDSADVETARANYPNIRFFTVMHRTAETPQLDLDGAWQMCTPETMHDFSAAAYFFARKVQQELNVPFGLINTSWGGTPAEGWTPEWVFEHDEVLAASSQKINEMPWAPRERAIVYNAMVAPLTPFRIAGALWYQGETNTANAETYTRLFSAMIGAWREAWGYEFPFYFAQIAPFTYGPDAGVKVRDAQRRTLAAVPNTGMIVTSDIGDTTDIHPRNKQDVGLRFAGLALKDHYGKNNVVSSGPLYRSMEVDGRRVRLFFDHAEGLQARGGKLTHFEVAGADGIFYPAQAEIKDNTVVVYSREVRQPVAVRFAWSSTATPNLFNGAGLPASAFTTEEWMELNH